MDKKFDPYKYKQWIKNNPSESWCTGVSDKPFVFDFSKACRLHDYLYSKESPVSRKEADWAFLQHMLRLAKRQARGFSDFEVGWHLYWKEWIEYQILRTIGFCIAIRRFLVVRLTAEGAYDGRH